jgi:hypothetical protein
MWCNKFTSLLGQYMYGCWYMDIFVLNQPDDDSYIYCQCEAKSLFVTGTCLNAGMWILWSWTNPMTHKYCQCDVISLLGYWDSTYMDISYFEPTLQHIQMLTNITFSNYIMTLLYPPPRWPIHIVAVMLSVY